MKGFKLLLIGVPLFFLGITNVNAANISWLDHSFRYNVASNSAELYTRDTSPGTMTGFFGPQKVAGSTPTFYKDFTYNGDPISSRANSIAESGGELGLVLKAGASGTHLTDGLKQAAYLETSSAHNNGIPSGYGIEYVGGGYQQQVIAWSMRRFELDSPGRFSLNGFLAGVIDADETFAPGRPPASAAYDYDEGITLYQNKVDEISGTVLGTSQVLHISLERLLNEREILEDIQLLTHVDGTPVTYDLKAQINLKCSFSNFVAFLETDNSWPALPEGALGYMGTASSPLELEATLTATQTPVPGSCMLLFSGIAALLGFRRYTIE